MLHSVLSGSRHERHERQQLQRVAGAFGAFLLGDREDPVLEIVTAHVEQGLAGDDREPHQVLFRHEVQHVAQIRRYESGTSQPTLNVTADLLVSDNEERGPDDDLRLAFEAIRQLDDDERRTVRDVIEAILLKHDARRWTNAG